MATALELYSKSLSTLRKTLNTLEQLNELKQTYASQEAEADEEIRKLELQLNAIKRRRLNVIHNAQSISKSIIQMEAAVQDLRSTFSPINEMPNEILLRIFSEFCRDDPLLGVLPAALFLNKVCSRWRSLVDADPSLWDTILIDVPLLESSSGIKHAQTIRHASERGQRSQQSLFLSQWPGAQNSLIDDLTKPHSTPWKSVRIIPAEPPFEPLGVQHLQANSVSILRKTGSIDGLVTTMRSATTLLIRGLPPDWGTLPWINLRVLTIISIKTKYPNDDSRDMLRGILRAAPYMTALNLQFGIDGVGTSLPADSPPVSHSKLESISLNLEHFSSNGEPFGIQLNTPALWKVKIHKLKRQAVMGGPTFYRNWAQPKHLILFIRDETITEAAELLRWYPSVEILEIGRGKTDALFTFIYTMLDHPGTPKDPLPLPKLTTLHIENTDLRGETLLAFLDARLRHVRDGTPDFRPLTTIYMYETPGVTPDDWKLVTEKLEIGRTLNGD